MIESVNDATSTPERLQLTPKQLRNFWKKVDRRGDDECWNWKAQRSKGYGKFDVGGMPHRAHRISFQMHPRILMPGEHALHDCDNPSCVNPAHLFAGTHTDNMRDMFKKGRRTQPRGEKQGRSKLKEREVAAIRQKYSSGYTNKVHLAKAHGVSRSLVAAIVERKIWKHVP
jgi:hypothetical protein